ncbi:MAG: GTP-binding protein, partial [Elusimicrobia bacterium]|nr:GTP-binding protein [Elusimicrobiota bacterium]
MTKRKIKNIAIIAHVDHGKTTLVDSLLKQTGTFRSNEAVADRVMDSNDIEKERGITIFSKNASLFYGGYKINIVDTPGHADFGGEVQRILKMVDSVLLLVDAYEGPMPQTKYVLKKSLELGLRPVVVINKIDRHNARPHKVLDQVFELFIELRADDDQLDFPIIYASARDGYSKNEIDDDSEDMISVLDSIIKNVADSQGDLDGPLQMLISASEYDNYVGKIATGKIHRGKIKKNDIVSLLSSNSQLGNFKLTKVYLYDGLARTEVDEALAGDIVSVAGTDNFDVGVTIADKDNPEALPSIEIDPPTMAIEFMVNDSPFAGLDGDYVTSRHIWDRLQREKQRDVSIQVERTDTSDSFTVKGRG